MTNVQFFVRCSVIWILEIGRWSVAKFTCSLPIISTRRYPSKTTFGDAIQSRCHILHTYPHVLLSSGEEVESDDEEEEEDDDEEDGDEESEEESEEEATPVSKKRKTDAPAPVC